MNIYSGISRTVQQLLYVVPDNYMETDVLLGENTLGHATFMWDDKEQICKWADFIYPVRHIYVLGKLARLETLSYER